MARTAETPAAASRGAGVTVTPVTINSTLVTNGVTIATSNPDKLVIRVANTDTSAHNLIVRAGTSLTPAFQSGKGDLTVAVPASGVAWTPELDSARYLQADGSLSLDFSTGMAGTLELVELP